MQDLTSACDEIRRGLAQGLLVLVVGNCRVQYEGRAASKLSEGDRLLVIKKDGTFLVHQGTKMNAINYQGPGANVSVELGFDANSQKDKTPTKLVVTAGRKLTNGAKESITVSFTSTQFCCAFPLTDDSKLKLFGTEKELSGLLMQDLNLIEAGLVPLQQESGVRKGNIDILARAKDGSLVAIEVKRRDAGLDAVTQLARYIQDLSKRKEERVRGILCSPHITDNALKMLEEAGLEYYKLSYEISNPQAKIRGLEKKQKALADF
jgi:RecB family endonuclease NucS